MLKTPSDQKGETNEGTEEQKSKDLQVEKPKHPDKPREESTEWLLCVKI